MEKNEVKREIVEYSKRLYSAGMVSVFEGNVSAKMGDMFIITPTQTDKSILTEDMLVEIDFSGNILNPECGKRPSSEWKMHAEAYRVREDVKAIIHCHSPYATAYAMAGKPIVPKALTEGIAIFKEVPLAPYGRPGTKDISASFQKLLKDYDALLLEAHGVIVVSRNMTDAYAKTEGLEKLAHMEFITSLLGGEKALPDSEISYLKALFN